MADNIVHVLETEAANDFGSLLAKVRAGAEVVIDSAHGGEPVAVMHAPLGKGRPLSECIALMSPGSGAVMDDDFAKAVEAAIESHREPLTPPQWD